MTEPDRRGVAVIVLTWNGLDYTRRCLEALRCTDHPWWRLIVVDNGSTDGTVQWLRTLDWITLIENGRNLGFTKGNNIGLAATNPGEDVLLLNNDIVVTDPGWLTKLADVAYADPANGLVGCRLVDSEGRINHIGSYVRPVTLYGEQMGGLERDIGQATRIRTIECTVFAVAYIRRDCLDRVGPLNEEMFAYLEDTDWCFRATRAGYRVMYAGNVSLLHHHNTSTKVNKVDIWSMLDKSRKVFTRDWAGWIDRERYDSETIFRGVMHRPMSMSVVSRQMMLALHFAGVRVSYENAYDEKDAPSSNPLLADLQKRKPSKDAPLIAYCNAHRFPSGGKRRTAGYTMLEVDGLPADWVQGCNRTDEVWVPSTFNAQTFRDAGVRVPIHVMPQGVDTDYFHPGITSYRPSDRFTFISIFEWGERKDPEGLLRAFAHEFKPSEDVALIVSVFNRDPSIDVATEIEKLNLPESAPIVLMVNAEFPDYQMGALYRSADCFVSASHGEGWGMPQLEAMACGLPVITTGWSGPVDFVNDSNGYLIDYTLVDAVARCEFYEGFRWAQADPNHLRSLMRHVADHPAEARAKGAKGAADVAAQWTWEHAARRIKQRLAT